MNPKPVKKAVIPAAGFGTRLYPGTKAIKKELFPIIDGDGRTKPVILAIVEEALSAGIEEIAIVVQPDACQPFQDFFQTPPSPGLWKKLSPQNQDYSNYLLDIGKRITFVSQPEQEGYGHAVYCAKDWVNNEPFLLLLGDHVYLSDRDISCGQQLLEIYHQVGHSVMGLTVMTGKTIQKAGCVTGIWQESPGRVKLTEIYEKPTLDYARSHLKMPNLGTDEFLAIFGLYILEATIFDFLEDQIQRNLREGGEFQLTSCLERLRQTDGMTGYLVEGKCLDTGLPDAYRQTIIDFRQLS